MIQARLLTITLFILLFQLPAMAQNEQSAENSLLPEINPQDIEIRSEFRARFPGLRRQPILGFNPEPRVYRIDPNRMPFMETREEAVAGIEMTELDRPEPPTRHYLRVPSRANAYIRAGIGSFLTPEAEAYGAKMLNDNSLLSGNLNYRSSEGHLSGEEGAFRNMDLKGSYLQKTNEKWSIRIDGGLLADHLTLFNPALAEAPQKTNTGVNAAVTIKRINNAFSGTELNFGGSLFTSEIPNGNADCSVFCYGGELNEKTYLAGYSLKWPGQNIYEVMRIFTNIEGGNYEFSGSNENWMHAGATFSYERLFNFQTRISGKAGIEYVKDLNGTTVYFAPGAEVKHNLTESITINGSAYAQPEFMTLQEHHQYNRFLDVDSNIRHSFRTGVNGEVVFKAIEGNSVFGGISFDHVKDYAFYQRAGAGTGVDGFYTINYDDANIFELYAGITQQLVPDKFWFDARAYGRNPGLSDGGDIPYEERLGLEGALSYKPFNKLRINAWAEYVGKREDPSSADDLGAFALINGGAEYQMNEKFGLYVKVLNILGQEYQIWNGYQERPFQVFGGLTIKF